MTPGTSFDLAATTVLHRLSQVSRELGELHDLDALLARLMQIACDFTGSERASILLVDETQQELFFRRAHGMHGEVQQTFRMPIDRSSVAGICVVTREPVLVLDALADPRHNKTVDASLDFVTRQLLAIPIVWGSKVFGCLEVLNKREGSYDSTDIATLTLLASQAAVTLHHVQAHEQFRGFFMHIIEVLVTIQDNLEPARRGHAVRVARLATALGHKLELSAEEIQDLLYAAYFREIGRLLSKNPLVGARDHSQPALSAQVLERSRLLERAAPAVRHHRERHDGSGFPDGLRGEAIPLQARILGLASHYDESWMQAKGLPQHVFERHFVDDAHDLFDPRVIDALIEVLRSNDP